MGFFIFVFGLTMAIAAIAVVTYAMAKHYEGTIDGFDIDDYVKAKIKLHEKGIEKEEVNRRWSQVENLKERQDAAEKASDKVRTIGIPLTIVWTVSAFLLAISVVSSISLCDWAKAGVALSALLIASGLSWMAYKQMEHLYATDVIFTGVVATGGALVANLMVLGLAALAGF